MNPLPLIFLLLTTAGLAFADNPPVDVQVSTRPLQAVFVWALGKDTGNAGDMELDLQEELIKHGVAGERSTKLFPKGMSGSTDALLKRLRKTVCDSVLVVRRTATVRWEAKEAQTASLKAFITHRAELLTPQDTLRASFGAPVDIPNVTANGTWEIVQGEALVFDLKSGRRLWQGNTSIKTAKDLPQAKYLQFVAAKVVHELEAAGFIGPIKN